MKMHKKLYKAGKNWLVATIMTGAAVMTFSTINAHADQVMPGANSQPQASAVAQVQGSSANSQSQPVAQQANVKVAATIDNNQNLQQRINQVQQSVDQQTQVVKQQQAMVDQAWNDYSQKINQSVAIDDEVKSTSQAYNNQKAQADTLYDQYNSLYEKEMAIKAQQGQVQQGSQYQSLLQQAKTLCPGYYTGTYSEKLQSVDDLQKNNLAQYNQFESLQKQMTDLLGNLPTQFSQAIDAAMMAFNKWKTVNDALENGSARQAYRDALAKQRDSSAATQAANLVWNNAKQKLDQDQAQLATLTAQLTALKQQLHEQTLSCTVTYVDAQGRTVGTEVLSGKDGQTFTSADLHLPVNYQLATGTAVSITLNAQTTAVTVNVVSTPAKVVHVTVNFVDAQSQQQLGSQVLTGQPGQQFTDHDLTIPAGYVFDNPSQGAFVITIGEQDDSTTIYLTRQQVKKTGFQHEDGGVFYYDQDGNRVMGEQVIDGHTYFFNPKANGLMATGIAEEKMGDPYYLFNDQGQKQGAGEHLY
ncbi:MAG TPA: KxYKxGKxW signal peptide domain-containing protein, partial [Candidatus Limosilactobacillus merdipullorum]|nr:KxYKxGKxW signal peptide domain-containing protein [Candidatus Limosilactobacillus merdipullorum]